MCFEPVPLLAASVSSSGSALLTRHLKTGPDVKRDKGEQEAEMGYRGWMV